MPSDLLASIAARRSRVAIIGQGYVGLVVSMRASEAGFSVVGVEINEQRAAELAAGRSYIEDVSDEDLERALAGGFQPTSNPSDLEDFDVAVISVPTPLTEGQPDLTAIESAGQALADHLSARNSGDPRINDVSRNYDRGPRHHSRERLGPHAWTRLHVGLLT